MLRKVSSYLPAKIRTAAANAASRFIDLYAQKTYSQEGEDMILRRIFESKKSGFYVDVGAHHPIRFSNTYYFYTQGWRGINIEPNPLIQRTFRSRRSRDVNIQMGVSDRPGTLTYYAFDEPALNSFDEALVKWRLSHTRYTVLETSEVAVDRLDHILEQYLPSDTRIDFLSIDVEGLDLAVLKSNDWQRFRPTCVLIEVLGTWLTDIAGHEISGFMADQRYALFAKTYNTCVFLDRSSTEVPRAIGGRG